MGILIGFLFFFALIISVASLEIFVFELSLSFVIAFAPVLIINLLIEEKGPEYQRYAAWNGLFIPVGIAGFIALQVFLYPYNEVVYGLNADLWGMISDAL